MPNSSFLGLPSEITEHICSYLVGDRVTLKRLARVSKDAYQYAQRAFFANLKVKLQNPLPLSGPRSNLNNLRESSDLRSCVQVIRIEDICDKNNLIADAKSERIVKALLPRLRNLELIM